MLPAFLYPSADDLLFVWQYSPAVAAIAAECCVVPAAAVLRHHGHQQVRSISLLLHVMHLCHVCRQVRAGHCER